MEAFVKFANYIQALNKRQRKQHLIGFIVGTSIFVGGMLYYIDRKSFNLINEVKRIESLADKSVRILQENQKMEDEAIRIQKMIDQNKDFNLKSYFESFCQQQGLPSQGWGDTRVEEINDRFDEISLTASFKGQTTEKLVKILEEFYRKEIIYIKSLHIRQEPDKKISFEITIATKTMKRGLD